VEQHVRVVAILNIVYGGLGVLIALFILLIFGGVAGLVAADGDPDAQFAAPLVGLIGGFVFVVILIVSAPAVIGGIGLLKFQSWARTLTIIVSILHLFSVPLGTALGIYGLWVLFKDETEGLLRSKRTA
jgi:hypothetical protein